VTDLSSTLEGADAHAVQALRTSQPNGPQDTTRAAMREVQDLLNRFTALYIGELATHDRVAQLLEMGRERGREWRDWSEVVKTAIERCTTPMASAAVAMLECWSELGERLARSSVSVQATNIGQHITMREEQLELVSKTT